MSRGWIDISVPIRPGMVCWPKNPPVAMERHRDIARGDHSTVSKLTLGVHTGTHMDAPVHFLPGEASIDAMDLSVTIGPARVLRIERMESGPIEPHDLAPFEIRPGERVLFRTHNSSHVWKTDDFVEEFVYFSPEAAAYLAEREVACVGIDYLSVGGLGAEGRGTETHQTLLRSGVWIIEGLDLSRVQPGDYDLVCLPLRIVGSDGAPARAAVQPR